jgi:O-antigen/teichoic acid export membrane protein
MRSNKRQLIANSVFLFFDYLSLSILSFLFWLIAGKTLAPEEYGIVATTINLILLLSFLCSLGFAPTIRKLTSEYASKKQKKKISALARFSIKVLLFSHLVTIFLLVLFSDRLSIVFKTTSQLIFFVAGGLFCYLFYLLFHSVWFGIQSMKKIFVSNLVGNIAKIIVSLLLLLVGFGYWVFAVGYVVSIFVSVLLLFNYDFIKPNKISINPKIIFLNYAIPAIVWGSIWMVLSNSQYIILTILKNPSVTGVFAPALIITSTIQVIPSILSLALFPIISGLSVNKETKKDQSYLIELTFKYNLFLIIPFSVFLVLFSKQAILIFSSLQYLESVTYFPYLALAGVLYGCSYIFLSNLYAIGKTKLNMYVSLFSTVTFLSLAIILTYFFSATGLSIAYVISMLLLFALSFFMMKKEIPVSIQFGNISKIIFATFIVSLPLYMLEQYIRSIIILLLTFPAALAYFLLLFPLKFFTKEDMQILETFIDMTPNSLKRYLRLIFSFILSYFNFCQE